MNVRDDMLIALVKEILGPRDGLRRCCPSTRIYSEYITGVLGAGQRFDCSGVSKIMSTR